MPEYDENAPEGGPFITLRAGQHRQPRPTLLLFERLEPTQLSLSVRQFTSAELAIRTEARFRGLSLGSSIGV